MGRFKEIEAHSVSSKQYNLLLIGYVHRNVRERNNPQAVAIIGKRKQWHGRGDSKPLVFSIMGTHTV